MEKIYYHLLRSLASLTPREFQRITAHFGNAENAWRAPAGLLKELGVTDAVIEELELKREEVNVEHEGGLLEKEKIEILTEHDPLYPLLLKEISSPPPLLYTRGKLLPKDSIRPIAVVGTREATLYGKEVTEPLVQELVIRGFTIISGMARGIDTYAHRAALDAGGRTIAILGTGIDQKSIYPSQNRLLAGRIAENGAVISEFPPGTMPYPHHFPQRNRIIAGLSLGTIVIEASEKSGALITARFALEEGREVFAVPGHIFSKHSVGTHRLIQQGAKLVSSVNDIIEELRLEDDAESFSPLTHEGPQGLKETTEEKILLDILQKTTSPIHVDQLIKTSGLAAGTVTSVLTMMELQNRVRNLGNNMYVRNM